MITLREKLLGLGAALSAPLTENKKGHLALEFVVAEKKAFLSRKKLVYRCSVRIDDASKSVKFFEILKESGYGLSGAADGAGPGFSFKKESWNTSGKERSGTIEEAASLFGEKYNYSFDYAAIRDTIKAAAAEAGYAFEVCLLERSL